jgi:hypothetical protein
LRYNARPARAFASILARYLAGRELLSAAFITSTAGSDLNFVFESFTPNFLLDERPMIFVKALLEFFPFLLSPPLVTLSSGTFRGLAVNSTDRWLGIPYAQPPVGSLRFKSPVAMSQPAEGIQDALQFSPACPQPPTTAPISEDCLYLNVRSTISDWLEYSISCIYRCGDHK